MKNFILIVLALTMLTACKKNREVVIQAQNISNLSDGSHYAGAKYVVFEKKTTLYGEQNKNVASGVLDNNGHANFELKMKNNRRYALGIQKPDNTCFTEVTIEQYLVNGENNSINFKYSPCAYLKFILNNVDCNGPEDSVTYKRTWISGDDKGNSNTYLGCDYYSGNYFERPVGEYRYDWEVTKNGVTTSHSQTFTLTENDSTVFEITY